MGRTKIGQKNSGSSVRGVALLVRTVEVLNVEPGCYMVSDGCSRTCEEGGVRGCGCICVG